MTIPLRPATRNRVLLLAALALAATAWLHAPIPQPQGYHHFADARAWLGIPNAWNVLSNLPFALAGAWGLALVGRGDGAIRFQSPWERWPWRVFFGGVLLTTFGSAWYHWAPCDARLLWDRLPMSVAFMALLAATLAERVGVRWARRLFVPMLLLGAGSVLWWHASEAAGHDDLRAYVFLVQGGSLVMIVLMVLLFPPRYAADAHVWAALAAYALAKVLEEADRSWLALAGMGGHALKHVAAAVAVGLLAWRLRGLATAGRGGDTAAPPEDRP